MVNVASSKKKFVNWKKNTLPGLEYKETDIYDVCKLKADKERGRYE